MSDDAESLQLLREVAASEVGLPAGLAHRVAGSTIGQLRKDARQLALDLGYAEPPEPQRRDQAGRFASGSGHQDFNNALRAAAGRAVQPAQQQPEGDLGIGKGAGAAERTPQPVNMNNLIRGVIDSRRSVAHVFAEQLQANG
jgi:hypothetical protein